MFKIIPIGFESLGVRSMATYIQTDDSLIVIDPSASLAPYRYSLPPHEIEWKRLHNIIDRISDILKDADAFIVTHYHYDHHDPAKLIDPNTYKGKIALVKDPRNFINISQRIRASRFINKVLKDRVRTIEIIDDRNFKIGDVVLKFSKPVPHGPNDKLGYVVMVAVLHEDGRLVFTSDVEGPLNDYEVDFIVSNDPNIVIIDGPPTYLLPNNYPEECLDIAINLNAKILCSVGNLNYLILDHHLLRDLNYSKFYDEVLRVCTKSKARLMTAAEFVGDEPQLLEARRRELYERF